MLLSELQKKNVINVFDGKLIGNVIDASISDGHVITFIVEKYRFFSFFNHKSFEVKWSEIEKIGKDVILVNIK